MLAAFAPVAPLGWTVFVELPVDEAYQPLIASMERSILVLLGALCLAALAGIFLARRMVVPIQALRAGAARLGGGDLSQRISVKTGDELEALADQFNDMAGRLEESYTGLEKKVELRTRELAQSVGELRALGEVTQAVNSTVDLETVSDHNRRQGDAAVEHRSRRNLCFRRRKPGIPSASDIWYGRRDRRGAPQPPYPHG